jgi:choline-sulfatase
MRRFLSGALVLVWLGSAACQRTQPQPQPTTAPRPSVVLISIDTLRADRLGCYGRAEAESPAIDGLAAQGVRFARAYSPLPLTLPAHATLLTGLQPPGHGLVDNGLTVADLGAPTLAERLQAAGYDTGGFVAAFVLNRVFGLDRGFLHYDDGPPEQTEMRDAFHGVADARERLDAALAWLARPRDRPFFLFLHLYDVHAPHVAPGPFAQRFASHPYDGEVAYVDSQVRRLLDVLEARGLTGHTLVVLTADHGESLGEHGEEGHGVFVYDATLHVPLVFRLPGRLPAGRVIQEAVELADVAPTVLDLVGLAPTTPSHGRARLGPRGAGQGVLWAQSDYPELHYGWARLRSVREGAWKYIEAPRPELYDLSRDPAEAKNQAAERPDAVARMASTLKAVEAELSRARPASAPKGPDEETRARLAALGYATGSAPTAGPRMDPKDGIALITGLDDALGALARGGPELVLAEQRYRKLTAQFPLNSSWFLGHGLALESLGRFDEAEAVYRRAAQLEGSRVRVLARLASLAA